MVKESEQSEFNTYIATDKELRFDEVCREKFTNEIDKVYDQSNLYVSAHQKHNTIPKCGTPNCDGYGNVNPNRARHYT